MSHDTNIMMSLHTIYPQCTLHVQVHIVVNIIRDKVFFVKVMVCVLKLDITVNAKLDTEETIVKTHYYIIVLGIRVKVTKHVKIEYIYDNSAHSRIV